VADKTQVLILQFLVPVGRLPMHVVATQTCRRRLLLKDHLADVLHHVTIAWIHPGNLIWRELDLEVTKKVISGNEVIRKRPPRAAGYPTSNMALATDGCDHPGWVNSPL
tara:strand:+ start:423 stop:749 length:327 start_codon:yes stop_codon:yes gene_type:complete